VRESGSSPEAPTRSAARPCIALSRLAGAGGTALGQRAAEWLGYEFLDRELIDRIAREEGIHHPLVAELDERIRGGIERTVALLRRRSFTERDYLEHLFRVVLALGERGGAVVVGRGAPFILPAHRALRVLVVAPKSVRLERFAQAQGLPHGDAVDELARIDESRRAFLVHNFDVRQDDPLLYDLVVNTGPSSIDAAAGIVVDALRRRFPDAGAGQDPSI
jgi:cytidylate kinase